VLRLVPFQRTLGDPSSRVIVLLTVTSLSQKGTFEQLLNPYPRISWNGFYFSFWLFLFFSFITFFNFQREKEEEEEEKNDY
jgi:hypothetical protein